MKTLKTLIDRYEDIKTIADFYGEDAQRIQAIKELSEAITELSWEAIRQLSYSGIMFTTDTLQELADVLIMIAQISYFADCECPDDHIMAETVNYKLDRTLEQIKNKRESE